jgi:hypothetical protein
MRKIATVALALMFVVTAACSNEPECQERTLSDGTICLVCTSSDLDGTNKRVDTSCVDRRQQ